MEYKHIKNVSKLEYASREKKTSIIDQIVLHY